MIAFLDRRSNKPPLLFTDKNPGDEGAKARFQRVSDAYSCLTEPEQEHHHSCPHHNGRSYHQHSSDDDDDGYGFPPGFGGSARRANMAEEFFRHFWSGGFDDDDDDVWHEQYSGYRAPRGQYTPKFRFDRKKQNEEAAEAAEKRSAAAAAKFDANALRKEAERITQEVPPRPARVNTDIYGLTLNLTRGNKTRGFHETTRSEVEYKRETDGPFRENQGQGSKESSWREIFIGQTTVTICGLEPGTRYRFRTRLGYPQPSDNDPAAVTWGAYGVESAYATKADTGFEKEKTAPGLRKTGNDPGPSFSKKKVTTNTKPLSIETKPSGPSQPVPVSSRETALAAVAAAEEAERVATDAKAEKKRRERLAAMTTEEHAAAAAKFQAEAAAALNKEEKERTAAATKAEKKRLARERWVADQDEEREIAAERERKQAETIAATAAAADNRTERPEPVIINKERPESVTMLLQMGFSETHACDSLLRYGGDVGRAADWLLTHADDLEKADRLAEAARLAVMSEGELAADAAKVRTEAAATAATSEKQRLARQLAAEREREETEQQFAAAMRKMEEVSFANAAAEKAERFATAAKAVEERAAAAAKEARDREWELESTRATSSHYEVYTAAPSNQKKADPPAKTRLNPCRHWAAKGSCWMGAACAFAHDPATASNRIGLRPSKASAPLPGTGAYLAHDATQSAKSPVPGKTSAKESRLKPCRHWAVSGSCKLGDECGFMHDASPSVAKTLKPKQTKAALPGTREFLAEDAAVSSAKSVPANRKLTKPCRNWATKGSCRLGDACGFLHDEASQSTANNLRSSTAPLPGTGGYLACDSTGPPAKTKLTRKPCRNWATKGSCKLGDACGFSHESAPGNKAIGLKPAKQVPLPGTREYLAHDKTLSRPTEIEPPAKSTLFLPDSLPGSEEDVVHTQRTPGTREYFQNLMRQSTPPWLRDGGLNFSSDHEFQQFAETNVREWTHPMDLKNPTPSEFRAAIRATTGLDVPHDLEAKAVAERADEHRKKLKNGNLWNGDAYERA